jgi:hypothetical protein
MKFLSTPTALGAEFRRLTKRYSHFDWAIAWATAGHDLFKTLIKYRAKIRRIIVGTHFHQTSPEFIEALTDVPTVRFCLNQDGLNGVFHPKLYLFSSDNGDWEAIIGSPNFTVGGFNRNVEHAVLIGSEDRVEGVDFSELTAEVDRLWSAGRSFTPDELIAYRLRWAKTRPLLDRAAGHSINQNRQKSIYNRPLLNHSWEQYVNALTAHGERFFQDRLIILKETARIWLRESSFTNLSVEDRKKIAGISSEKKLPWKLFGSMQGAIKFKEALRDENPQVIEAVDLIPLSGPVTRTHYEAYRAEITKAPGMGLAVITRLLCLRRPDYFICVDSKNRKGLCSTLGISTSNVTVSSYWDTVVAPFIDTPWWNSSCPESDDDSKTIWNGRIAMVDSIFYDGH